LGKIQVQDIKVPKIIGLRLAGASLTLAATQKEVFAARVHVTQIWPLISFEVPIRECVLIMRLLAS